MKDRRIPGGFILLSRKIIESEIWRKPPLYLKVWIYLLTSAQHSDYKGLKRGQLYTSIPEIIEACSWRVGYRTERPSKDQIFQIINWLRKVSEAGNEANTKATMITTTRATHGMLITVDNYAFYQDSKNYESNGEDNDEKVTKPTRGQRQPNNINKNDKNDKNDNKEPSPRNKKTAYSEDNRYYKMARYFHKKIMEHAVVNKKDHLVRSADLQKWADDFRKIVEIDKRDTKEMQRIIDWATSDPFWQLNILSPDKLRKQYVQLGIKMNAGLSNNQTTRAERNKKLLLKKMEEARKVGSGGNTQALVTHHDSLPDGRSDRGGD